MPKFNVRYVKEQKEIFKMIKENELTKEIYKSSSKINNYLSRIKLPEMKAFSSEKIDYYIDIIIKDYESV